MRRHPRGEIDRHALLEYVLETDDRAERYFLEVKSKVDLTTKRDQAKVAKFILGAANRDPAIAERRFEGHALMVLGVALGEVVGVPAFEAMDLKRAVTKLIGVDGPGWDFDRISTANGDVIIIDVDPPTGSIPWTCRADGDGLRDGDIYVREDGETRAAKGDEIRAMLSRAVTRQAPVDVAVEVLGQVASVGIDMNLLSERVETEASALLKRIEPAPPSTFGYRIPSLVGSMETRTKPEFRREVEEWRADAMADPTDGLVEIVASHHSPIQLKVMNRTTTYLRSVRIEIEFETDGVRAVEQREQDDDPHLFPGRPKTWGAMQRFEVGSFASAPIPGRHGWVQIRRESPAALVLELEDLRSNDSYLSDPDDVVLFTIVGAQELESVQGRWRLTVADVNEDFTGEFTMPVAHRDWNEVASRLPA